MRIATSLRILVRGGGDLSSGVILRLARAGFKILVLELPNPTAVRRSVSFAQAIYDGFVRVEEIEGRMVETEGQAWASIEKGIVAVKIDPTVESLSWYQPDVLVDGRMLKSEVDDNPADSSFVIGLGPGFRTGKNCNAVIETMRGPFLGRVIWDGEAEKDTGIPDRIGGVQAERVLRAPVNGNFTRIAEIGDHLVQGQSIGWVGGELISAPFEGILRGLIQDGTSVTSGLKIGDLDPRLDTRIWRMVSDKALSVGGGVLEVILSNPALRKKIGR